MLHWLPAEKMSESEEEAVVSLQEVLEETNQLEETANAVLGGSDDASCTYPNGYVDRQALYACGTCSSSSETGAAGRSSGGQKKDTMAGICLACSLHCHEGHDLYELYTKRRFRCDCGNSKFPAGQRCNLHPEKTAQNHSNRYNHNFRGLYCVCNRPYPDPDDQVEDEMIQCCVCEDWFHSRHLRGGGGASPPAAGYEEMVCGECMATHQFLKSYQMVVQPVKVKREDEKKKEEKKEERGKEEKDEVETVNVDTNPSSSGVGGGSGDQSHDRSCELKRRQEIGIIISSESEGGGGSAGYFSSDWRSQLCHCSDCMTMYRKSDCEFLLDNNDTIAAYEARAVARPSSHETAMSAFSSTLDRVQQVEAIHQYNDMKTELVDFLKEFAKDRKVVSRGDVERFFEGMQAKKKQKLETGEGVPPANCHF